MTVFTSFTTNISVYGPRQPDAWDGDSQHLMESVTNNARYYGVSTDAASSPAAQADFGFTDTSTSNAQYTYHSDFTRPACVPIPVYVDSEPTNKYQMTVLFVAGPTITELGGARVPYPSQTFSSAGFIRSWQVWPDQTTFIMYGGGIFSGSPTLHAYSCTVDSIGHLGTITDLGTVTYPSGAFPGAGSNYLSGTHPGRTFSDRLAWDDATRGIYDRLNPTTIIDGYPFIASSTGGVPAGDKYSSSARAAPGHLLAVERNSGSTSFWVRDYVFNSTGTSATNAPPWAAPSGTAAVAAGFAGSGKIVALTRDGAGVVSVWWDIAGTPIMIDNSNPDLTVDGYTQVVPTLGTTDSFLVVGQTKLVQYSPDPTPPGIIRNLVINPSGEQSFDRAWTASNGVVETNVTWMV